jgi:hypothetical protein
MYYENTVEDGTKFTHLFNNFLKYDVKLALRGMISISSSFRMQDHQTGNPSMVIAFCAREISEKQQSKKK